MNATTLDDTQLDELLRRADEPVGSQAARALLGELWAQRHGDAPVAQAALPAAERLGAELGESEVGVDALVRRVQRLGRALAEYTLSDGALDLADAQRVQLLADEAVARAAAALEQARHRRREAWLAYLTHELKNPLNTVLNAVWLLREHPDAPNAPRFLELAERAVRRLEGTIKEVRALHRNAQSPPPVRDRNLIPGAPPPK